MDSMHSQGQDMTLTVVRPEKKPSSSLQNGLEGLAWMW